MKLRRSYIPQLVEEGIKNRSSWKKILDSYEIIDKVDRSFENLRVDGTLADDRNRRINTTGDYLDEDGQLKLYPDLKDMSHEGNNGFRSIVPFRNEQNN